MVIHFALKDTYWFFSLTAPKTTGAALTEFPLTRCGRLTNIWYLNPELATTSCGTAKGAVTES